MELEGGEGTAGPPLMVESFSFEDENEYEYEINFNVSFCVCSQNKDTLESFILFFFS